ncbi:helix-turn-helix domain-containing protein [Anditalea andensis]|uniref:XRE family transcriptional regulator n=1 Tax=Anditalea andensis TaxID=1048983 RepID=A0A074LD34_9BACT|nr:helix-turn-helix transcriptional regulator [Anditalea andensis]KEO71682.1 XRE family transcriptional regulator [Anditalea andensis]
MESGKIIATLRDSKNWSQTDLANNSNVSRVMIGKYERGEAIPSIDAAKKIADAFEVSLDYLVGVGQNARFDKKTVQRLQDIEALSPTIKDKLFFLIDTVIRDRNAQKAYMQ